MYGGLKSQAGRRDAGEIQKSKDRREVKEQISRRTFTHVDAESRR